MKALNLVLVGALSLGSAPALARPVAPRLPTAFRMPRTPADAKKIIAAFEARRAALMRRFEKQLEPLRRRAAKKLKKLQDRLCRQARLDDALAVRRLRLRLLGARKDPGYLRASAKDIGRSFLYRVRGSTGGSIWGTGIYTTDSKLATAAVHAGVVRPGQIGVVRVRILPGQPSYMGSTAHGVTSHGYGSWAVSFKVEQP